MSWGEEEGISSGPSTSEVEGQRFGGRISGALSSLSTPTTLNGQSVPAICRKLFFVCSCVCMYVCVCVYVWQGFSPGTDSAKTELGLLSEMLSDRRL